MSRRAALILALLVGLSGCAAPDVALDRAPGPSVLPRPILPALPWFVALYDKAWSLAQANVHHGSEANGLADAWIDEAFALPNIYQWDTCFILMFARYGAHALPAAASLDNFYSKQHPDGFICREISELDGADVWPKDSAAAINPPLFAWAEWALYQVTANPARLTRVLPKLVRYYDWVKAHRTRPSGAYWSSGFGCGMDNAPRGTSTSVVDDFGMAWVDMTAQQAGAAQHLAQIAAAVGDQKTATRFLTEHADLVALLNTAFWDPVDGLYYDIGKDGRHTGVQTLASFWPMLAAAPSQAQCEQLVGHLMNPATFWRPNPFPTLAANHPDYDATGQYWRGAVWAPTNYMVIKGLETCGEHALAAEAAERHISHLAAILETTGTLWENTSAERPVPGKPAAPDFVGWAGAGPIALLIENVLGFTVNGPNDRLTWRLQRTDLHGIADLRFGDNIVTVHALARSDALAPAEITVESTSPFTLVTIIGATQTTHEVPAGRTVL